MGNNKAQINRSEEERKRQQGNSSSLTDWDNPFADNWLEWSNPFGGSKPDVKAKMEVSQPGDASEMQADAVADAVMRGDAEAAQMEFEQTGGEILAKASGVTLNTPPGFEERMNSMKGGGMPLDEEQQEKMEGIMGENLDHVRLHTGDAAEELSESINARAFAHGDDVFIPDTTDEELLAHEVVHTVQSPKKIFAKVHRQFSGEEDFKVSKLPKIDTSKWELNADTVSIYIRSGEKYYFASTQALPIYRIPENVSTNGRVLQLQETPVPVGGVPATGPSSSLITIGRTSNGSIVTMIDAGSKVGSGIYMEQLNGLMGRLGINSIDYIQIIHNHEDHVNRIEDLVINFQVRSENLWIEPYLLYSRSLRETMNSLATGQNTSHLGYSRYATFQPYQNSEPGELIHHLNFQRGSLVYNFFVPKTLITSLSSRATDYLAGNAGKPDTKLEDAASFIGEVSSLVSEFRMLVLGDLRGRDYTNLRAIMETESPGSFSRLMRRTTLIAGFHHHLGVVENALDVEGIRLVLQETLFHNAKLEVIVQTSTPQMRPALVEALQLLGVSVVVVGSGTVGETSGAVLYSNRQIVPYGQASMRYEPAANSRILIEEIINLRAKYEIFLNFITYDPNRFSVRETESIRTAFKTEIERLEQLNTERTDLILSGLPQSTSRAARNNGLPQNVRTEVEEINSRVYGERESDFSSRTYLDAEVMQIGISHKNYTELINEFNEELVRSRTMGRPTGRFLTLFFALADEKTIENITGKTAAEILVEGEVLHNRMRSGEGDAPNPGVSPKMRVFSGAMAALMIFSDVVLPIIESRRRTRKNEINMVLDEIIWMESVRLYPIVKGVITNSFSSDEIIEDRDRVKQLWQEDNLDRLMIDGVNPDSYDIFMIWLYENIKNVDDYAKHFEDPMVFHNPMNSNKGPVDIVPGSGDDFKNRAWQVKKYNWDTVNLNELEYTWQTDDKLTLIMNEMAKRVITETTSELNAMAYTGNRDQLQTDAPQESNVTIPNMPWAPNIPIPDVQDRPVLETANTPGTPTIKNKILRRIIFKEDAEDKNCYGPEKNEVIIAENAWWKGFAQTEFYELEAYDVPDGYIAVMGANYNTYAQIRIKPIEKVSIIYPIYKYYYYTDKAFEYINSELQEIESLDPEDADENAERTQKLKDINDVYTTEELEYFKYVWSNNYTKEFVSSPGSEWSGYYVFPGEGANDRGVALLKKESVKEVPLIRAEGGGAIELDAVEIETNRVEQPVKKKKGRLFDFWKRRNR